MALLSLVQEIIDSNEYTKHPAGVDYGRIRSVLEPLGKTYGFDGGIIIVADTRLNMRDRASAHYFVSSNPVELAGNYERVLVAEDHRQLGSFFTVFALLQVPVVAVPKQVRGRNYTFEFYRLDEQF